MKIVIPSNDKITVAPRSGRALYFMIFDIVNHEIINTSIKENKHEHHHHGNDLHSHEHGHSHADMVEQLKDCDLMITQKVGPHFGPELKAVNIKIEICGEQSIEDALKQYL